MNHKFSSTPATSGYRFQTARAAQTIALGQALGRRLEERLVLMLHGELGSGKTAFTQGLARGLGVPEDVAVTSPTYTLINEYFGRLPLYHADLYRLPAPIDPEEIGLLELFEDDGIVAVEWAQRLHPDDLPTRRLDLFFTVTAHENRTIRIIEYGLARPDLLLDIDV